MTTFSFILPVKQGGELSALPFLQNLTTHYPFEIIVAEGCAPSKQRNKAACVATGTILYFLDDDSRITSDDILSRCAVNLENESIAVAGGPSLTPVDNSPLQQLFGIALSSFFGSGPMCFRYRLSDKKRVTTEKELILCNMAIRRDVFMETGGFDERLYPNEENELLDRIQSKGLQLIHDPAMAIYRSQRESLVAFVRQMFAYGRGRGQQTRLCKSISIISLAPLLFVSYLISFPFLLLLYPFLIAPLICYVLLSLLFSIEGIIRSRSIRAAWLFFLFPLMHCTNGSGLLYGLLIGPNKQKLESTVTIRTIKNLI